MLSKEEETSDKTGVAQLWYAEELFNIARGLESNHPKKGKPKCYTQSRNTKILYLGT